MWRKAGPKPVQGSCGKLGYWKLLDAKIALANTQRKRGSNREEQRVYRCAECRLHHLTKKR